MTEKFGFDERNQEDYDKNTQLIVEALEKIRRFPSLKTTKAELVRLTGLSRNTISNRANSENPSVINNTLAEISENRKKSVEVAREKNNSAEQEAVQAREQLEKGLIHWFVQSRQLQSDLNDLTLDHDRMKDSRDFYKLEMENEREKNRILTKKLELLEELLSKGE